MMDLRPGNTDDRHIVDRGWTFRLGSLRITRWDRRYSGPAPMVEWPPRRRAPIFGGRIAIAASGICTIALIATSLIAERVGAGAAYALTIPVPPSVRTPSSPKPDVGKTIRSDGTGHYKSRKPVTTRLPLVLALDETELADTVAVTATSSKSLALKTALATGDMQEWTDPAAGIRGYVVAGPLKEEAGRQCRAIAVMTRSATAGDTVEQRQDCLG